MAKNQKNQKQENVESKAYDLKTDAVDRLVNADKKTYPNTKGDPGKAYRSGGFLSRIPDPIKAIFIKFWYNGAVCFFIFWGLGMFVWDTLDMIIVLGVVMGMVTDILVNNTFHFFAIMNGSNNKWMMFPQKKQFWTFFANIAYGIFVMFIVSTVYSVINVLLNTILHTENTVYLGVEPVMFGLLYVAVDLMFIGMKNLSIKIVDDAKKKADITK